MAIFDDMIDELKQEDPVDMLVRKKLIRELKEDAKKRKELIDNIIGDI